jgi:integration host factor subunit beta
MNKSELIAQLSKETGAPLKKAGGIVNTILDAMTERLVNGDNIEFRGFCSFSVKKYKAYPGKNPKTGKKVEIKSKKLPFFRIGKELKDSVNAKNK